MGTLTYDYDPRINPNVSSINTALTGERKTLMTAFLWHYTPQGFDHWAYIYDGIKPLDEASRSYLIRLRDAVLAREKGE